MAEFAWLKDDHLHRMDRNMLDLMAQPISPYEIVRADPASLAQLITAINKKLKEQRPHLLEFGWAVVFDKLQTADWLAYIADVMTLYERVGWKVELLPRSEYDAPPPCYRLTLPGRLIGSGEKYE